jgi:hypothetical protein
MLMRGRFKQAGNRADPPLWLPDITLIWSSSRILNFLTVLLWFHPWLIIEKNTLRIMGMFTKLPKELEEVDVIVAGGGLAGCVVAGRLAEADPSLSILVIEQGPNNYEVDQVVYPALYPRNLFPNSKYTLFWQGNHSPQLADRRPIVPSGGTLGGG